MAFNYTVNPDFDFIFDEKGNTFLALRKIAWSEGGQEKLDIRKYYNSSDGTETVGKGVSFITEEGPHELTRILVENNYGYTDEILNGIKNRDDFKSSLVKVLGDEDIKELGLEDVDPNEEYFDPVESLLD